MPKRMTDTEKWKKPFLRGLNGAYKLLWFYILDDCDYAGIWQVDFEVARIRIGEQNITYEGAVAAFGDRIQIIGKFKWFLSDFIDFQYGELKETNRMHVSVIKVLNQNGIKGYQTPLPRGQGQGQGKGQEEGLSKGEELNDYEYWTMSVLENNDATFEQMAMKEKWPPGFDMAFWVNDHLGLIHRYPKMRPGTQQSFRHSLLKHLRENKQKEKNGITKAIDRAQEITKLVTAKYGK